jgi:hypothetical protein
MSSLLDRPAFIRGRGLARAALVAGVVGAAGTWLTPFFEGLWPVLLLGGMATTALAFLLGLLGLVLAAFRPEEYRARRSDFVYALLFAAFGVGGFANSLPSGHSRVGAYEAGTIGDIRALVSAEVAYSTENGGFFDRPECLQKPTTCIPGFGQEYKFLDDAAQWAGTRHGYVRTFQPGPAAPADVLAQGKVSPSSVTSYTYVGVPKEPGLTGVRGFCGDFEGRITFTKDGTPPPVKDGHCVVTEGVRPLG